MLRIIIAATVAALASAATSTEYAAAQVTGALPTRATAVDTALPAIAAYAAPAVPAANAAPTLRRAVVVSGEIVHIGDLVDNAGSFAAIPVFRAPDVGTTGAVPARKIVEAARAHNMFGVDTGDVIEVEVTRAGRIINRKELEGQIARLFSGTSGLGAVSDLAVTFDRIPANINADLPPDTELKAMRASYDARSSRFDVVFDVPVGVSRRIFLRYTGTLVETADAVVPNRTIARGEVLRAADLAIERRPRSEVTADVPTSTALVIGRAARQALRQGVAIHRNDLVKPEIVKRDDGINLVYQVPGITLTARGKALESGGEGDIINVLNPQSKRTVQGVIVGPGRVDISPPRPVVAASAASETGIQ